MLAGWLHTLYDIGMNGRGGLASMVGVSRAGTAGNTSVKGNENVKIRETEKGQVWGRVNRASAFFSFFFWTPHTDKQI